MPVWLQEIKTEIKKKPRPQAEVFYFEVFILFIKGPFSLPDEASGQNVVETVFVLPVFVLKYLHSDHPM